MPNIIEFSGPVLVSAHEERRGLWSVDGRLTFSRPEAAPDTVLEGWVLPGFVDAHCHIGLGAGGAVDEATTLEQARTDLSAGTLLVRDAGSPQPEGCVADPRDGTLYVGEEAAGIWRFAAGESEGELVAPVDNRHLVADVEGLALLPEGADGGYLVASSQGDNAYAVFRLPDLAPLGRFAIAAGEFGGTEETDGIELASGSFGPHFPDGLFVAQDGHNLPRAQNFKLVSWSAIKAALGL